MSLAGDKRGCLRNSTGNTQVAASEMKRSGINYVAFCAVLRQKVIFVNWRGGCSQRAVFCRRSGVGCCSAIGSCKITDRFGVNSFGYWKRKLGKF